MQIAGVPRQALLLDALGIQARVQRFAKVSATLLHLADTVVNPGEVRLHGAIVRIAANQLFLDIQSLGVAHERFRGTPQVGASRQAEHIPDALIRHGALALQPVVTLRFGGQSVEVSLRALHQQFPRPCGAGQSLDRIVQFEEHRIRQPAQLLEAPLRPRPLPIRRVHLPRRGDDPAHQRQ